MAEAARTRRRGAELEDAILDAAWDQLVSEGYGRFTIDTVAERAHTSKPVLYRRWDDRLALLRATIRRRGASTSAPAPDTGDLREDLREAMHRSLSGAGSMAALLTVLVSSHFEEIGMTPHELRAEMIGHRETSIQQIFARAVERGEVDPAVLTPRIIDLPFTLFRHEYIMTFRPPTEAALDEFLDQIVLPLVRRRPAADTQA